MVKQEKSMQKKERRVMNQQYEQRIRDLVRALDAMTSDIPSVDGMDLNEITGMYDGRIMAIRDLWRELKQLMGLSGVDQ
ncbi:MAG: hypothetical protein SF162_07545 [bacterium]|nr:hypothetical protein [bacterium]